MSAEVVFWILFVVAISFFGLKAYKDRRSEDFEDRSN